MAPRSSSPANAIAATPAATPGSYDPVVVYAYKLPTKAQFASAAHGGAGAHHSGKEAPKAVLAGAGAMQIGDSSADPVFARTVLSINGTASAGTQFVAADLDKDGDIDIASAGKLGVHVLENLRINKVPKQVREDTQPLNRKWPFPGEGKDVEQEDGPTPPSRRLASFSQRLIPPTQAESSTTGLGLVTGVVK